MSTPIPDSSEIPPLWCLARDAAIRGHLAAKAMLAEDCSGEAHRMWGHVGAVHLPIDVIAHEAIERFVYANHAGPVQVVGEEVRRSMPTTMPQPHPTHT